MSYYYVSAVMQTLQTHTGMLHVSLKHTVYPLLQQRSSFVVVFLFFSWRFLQISRLRAKKLALLGWILPLWGATVRLCLPCDKPNGNNLLEGYSLPLFMLSFRVWHPIKGLEAGLCFPLLAVTKGIWKPAGRLAWASSHYWGVRCSPTNNTGTLLHQCHV